MISNKSTKVLNFIKLNLYNCPPDTKRTAYLALVRPIMEYAAPVCDPYYNIDTYKLEKVQRRAARWILFEYSRTISVTSLLSTLNIPTLQQRRQSSRLTLFYKIINNSLPISISAHYQRTQFHTRQHHLNHFILPQATLNTYKYSFYPRTIKDWNNLPINVIESRDIDKFTYLIIVIISLIGCMHVIVPFGDFHPLGQPAELTAQYLILNLCVMVHVHKFLLIPNCSYYCLPL